MSKHIIHKLLFSLVSSDQLIFETTCWRRRDIDSGEPILDTKRNPNSSGYNGKQKFSDADHLAVALTLQLIDALEIPNAIAKNQHYDVARKQNHIAAYVSNHLNTHWVDLSAKNSQWKRYEAALLSVGFILNEGCRSLFTQVLYSNKKYVGGDFTPEYFPFLQKFQAHDQLLTNSGLFASTYEGDYNKKAESLKIVNWFKKMEIDLPRGLYERVSQFQTSETTVSKLQQDQNETLNPKAKASMLALIHSMAKARPYRYDPSDSRNGAIKRVEFAVLDAELNMSERTIREYLKVAQEEAERQKEKNQ